MDQREEATMNVLKLNRFKSISSIADIIALRSELAKSEICYLS
jgi:hypothetical protein